MTDIMPEYSSPVKLKLQPAPPFLNASCEVVKVGLSLMLNHATVTVGAHVEAIILRLFLDKNIISGKMKTYKYH